MGTEAVRKPLPRVVASYAKIAAVVALVIALLLGIKNLLSNPGALSDAHVMACLQGYQVVAAG